MKKSGVLALVVVLSVVAITACNKQEGLPSETAPRPQALARKANTALGSTPWVMLVEG